MSPELFLHERDDFKDLIQVISADMSIVPQLVEKDYWIMHCLWGLQKQFQLELKGGTSLSKGYKIIDRFSEDLDIHIEPPAQLEVKSGKNHDKDTHIESRRKFFEWINDTIKIPGIDSVVRDTEFDDKTLRNGGIRLHYKSYFPSLRDVKEGILLEVGFDDTAPNQAITISSWAVDLAAVRQVPFRDNRAVDVKCYSPAFTFVEKLQTISTKFRQQQKDGKFPRNFMRHYYDVHQLLAQPEVQKFMETETYEKRKRERFRTGDNLKIPENEAFLLRDKKTRALYETEYRKTEALYYKGQVPFSDILRRIKENLARL